jgi:hypothetical protein
MLGKIKEFMVKIKDKLSGIDKGLQKLGMILLGIAVVLLFLKAILSCYIVLGLVLILDLWLVFKKERTITQWFRPWLPKWVDYILTVGIIVLFVYFHSPIVGLYMLIGTINGHLNGDW